GDQPGASGFRWVIDPIDGTRAFIRGIPLWGTLVGLEYQNDTIAGIAYNPVLGELHRALRGDGCYRNDRRIRVTDEADLSKAMMNYSGMKWFQAGGRQEQFLKLCEKTDRQRGLGDYYGFVLVAQGS